MISNRKGQPGICLYEVKNRKVSESGGGRGPLLFLVRSLLVWLLAVAWQRGFQSVFPIRMNEKWMYGFLLLFSVLACLWAAVSFWKRAVSLLICGGMCVVWFWKKQTLLVAMVNPIANAYLRVHNEGDIPLKLYQEPTVPVWMKGLLLAAAIVPLLLMWSYVITKNRGRVLVFLSLLAPAVLAAVEGYFITLSSCWFLLFSAGIYFAVCGGYSGKMALKSGMCACLCMLVLLLAGSAAVRPLETMKRSENGIYLKARNEVSKNVVQKLEDLTSSSEKKEKKTDQTGPEKQKEEEQNKTDLEEQKTAEETEQEKEKKEQGTTLSDQISNESFLPDKTQNLKAIAAFSPGDGDGIIVKTSERPKGTYYYPEEYGGSYDGNSWSPEALGDDVSPKYSEYPENLERLISFCQEQKVENIEDAARFIQQEFEKQTVYDYQPGPTPKDQDFAEYFLFENKRGFCVHFATTATLMYRIFGYQARYAQGYAIPASAFEKQPDGTYAAKVTGDMGHAWCETYENGWKVREHTLPYTGKEPQVLPPAQNSSENSPVKEPVVQKVLTKVLTAVILLVLAVGLFLFQSAVRRKQRFLRCRKYRQGRGILELYESLYEIALFLGMEKSDPVSTKTFHTMKQLIGEIPEQEWEWIHQIVLQTLFGQSCPSKEEHEKLFRIVSDMVKKVGRKQSGLKRLEYRYIKSLG